MARQAAAMPTLFKRSDHGSYCFRRVIGTKRTTINTGTSDYSTSTKESSDLFLNNLALTFYFFENYFCRVTLQC